MSLSCIASAWKLSLLSDGTSAQVRLPVASGQRLLSQVTSELLKHFLLNPYLFFLCLSQLVSLSHLSVFELSSQSGVSVTLAEILRLESVRQSHLSR